MLKIFYKTCEFCGKQLDNEADFCGSCGHKLETAFPVSSQGQIPLTSQGSKSGVQYKTIAGPVELMVKPGLGGLRPLYLSDYENSVKQYARIIDHEAVGGWKLHLIQQISVKKLLWYTVILGAILGAILGLIVGGQINYGDNSTAWFFYGLLIGAVFGCLGIRRKTVLFNMLVFVKEE